MKKDEKILVSFQLSNGYFNFHRNITTIESKNSFSIVSHTHKWYEIMQLMEGEITYNVNGRRYDLAPGDIMIINNNEFHSIDIHSKIYERRVLEFDFMFLLNNYSNLTNILSPFEENPDYFNKKIASEKIKKSNINFILDNIEKRIQNQITIIEYINVYTAELLLDLNEIWNNSDIEKRSIYASNPHVEKTLNYIKDNLYNKITLSELEKHANLTKYHLCHLFKQHIGTTLINYVNFKKILCAEKLIQSGKSPKEASELLSYTNYSNFYNQYKKVLNKTPAESTLKAANKP